MRRIVARTGRAPAAAVPAIQGRRDSWSFQCHQFLCLTSRWNVFLAAHVCGALRPHIFLLIYRSKNESPNGSNQHGERAGRSSTIDASECLSRRRSRQFINGDGWMCGRVSTPANDAGRRRVPGKKKKRKKKEKRTWIESEAERVTTSTGTGHFCPVAAVFSRRVRRIEKWQRVRKRETAAKAEAKKNPRTQCKPSLVGQLREKERERERESPLKDRVLLFKSKRSVRTVDCMPRGPHWSSQPLEIFHFDFISGYYFDSARLVLAVIRSGPKRFGPVREQKKKQEEEISASPFIQRSTNGLAAAAGQRPWKNSDFVDR